MRKKNSAFTLLELLLATAMMSMLAGSLYASLHIAFEAREAAMAAVEPARTAALTLELLRQDLECTLPPVGILAGEFIGTDEVDESGRDADTLVLHSSVGETELEEGGCGIVQVEFAFEAISDGEEPALIRRVTSNLLAPEVPEPREEVLCRRIFGFGLSYFDGYDWLDSWDSTTRSNTLPEAVEVTLELGFLTGLGSAIETYRVSRVFLLPCGGTTEGERTSFTGTTGR